MEYVQKLVVLLIHGDLGGRGGLGGRDSRDRALRGVHPRRRDGREIHFVPGPGPFF